MRTATMLALAFALLPLPQAQGQESQEEKLNKIIAVMAKMDPVLTDRIDRVEEKLQALGGYGPPGYAPSPFAPHLAMYPPSTARPQAALAATTVHIGSGVASAPYAPPPMSRAAYSTDNHAGMSGYGDAHIVITIRRRSAFTGSQVSVYGRAHVTVTVNFD